MIDDQIQDNIREFGWHCRHVFDAEGERVDFSYSIGFEKSFGEPEIIVFGLKREISHAILSDIATDFRGGLSFEPNTRISGVVGGVKRKLSLRRLLRPRSLNTLGEL